MPSTITQTQSGAKRSLLLAIDNVSLPLRRNLTLHINQPHVHKNPVLAPRRDDPANPDYLAALFYGSVLYDDGKFRMWYSPVGKGPDPAVTPEFAEKYPNTDAKFTRGPICYAESNDGIHWERPALYQYSYRGNTNHNGLQMVYGSIAGAAIICDSHDADENRRYKALFTYYIYDGSDNCASLGIATSPDGIHWTAGPPKPLGGEFLELTGFHRHGNMYVAIGQKGGPHYSENATPSARQGRAHISYDCDHWDTAQAEALLLPEPRVPSERGGLKPYDQVHVGIGTANFNNVTIGLYGLWHNHPNFSKITSDLGLVISNDGLHFRQVVQGMPYIRHQDSPIAGIDSSQTMLTQGNGIINVGDCTLIYHGRWTEGRVSGDVSKETGTYTVCMEYEEDYYSEIALAEIPRDRWGGLGVFPNAIEGHVWTAPFRLPDAPTISLNATDAKGITVDIATEQLQLIEEFQDGKCAAGDGLDSPLSWANDLNKLAGKTVRLRINFKRDDNCDPRLFAVNVDEVK